MSSQPHNQARTPALLLLSSACLWVSLGTSWSLSFLIRKVGSIPPSHRPAAGPAEASAVLCGPQGAPGTSISPLGARRRSARPDSVSFVSNRIRSLRLGNIRLFSATLGNTGLCSASSALFGSVRLLSAQDPTKAPPQRGGSSLTPARPGPRMQARRPEQSRLSAVSTQPGRL